jgi:uncharacterized surface protein with fasciclin (FAS1) repeats
MRRREFLGVLGGGAAWPLAARAQQQPAMPVVGFLSAVSPAGFEARVREFRLGLKDAGYVEGENVSIEYRWAENRLDRLPALGGELVRQKVAVIVATGGTAAAIAAKGLNTTIPVIFGIPEDPVKLGLVMNLARPGANMTGVNFFTGEVLAKRLELLRELVPTAVRVAVFVNPANPERAATQVKELEAAAGATGLQLRVYNTGSVRDINLAFATLARERPALPTAVTAAALAFATLAASPTAAQTTKEQTVTVGGAPMYPSKNIIQNAVNSKDHTTLVAAVKAAGLVETLQRPGPFTVFAPTNKAFAKLPAGTLDELLRPQMKEKLAAVLTYHVLPGRFSIKDLWDASIRANGPVKMKTVAGKELSFEFKGQQLTIRDSSGSASRVTVQNVFQSNGVIHVIDNVMLPS